jgi:hypothetical protein
MSPDVSKSVVIVKSGNLGVTKFLGSIMIISGVYNLLVLFFLIFLWFKDRHSTFDIEKMKY